MKIQKAITMQLHTRKWFGTNYGEMVFANYQDFKNVLRFFRDIKHDLYETDYQWKFEVSYNKTNLLIRIEEKKGVEKNSGIEQCLDLLRINNVVEVNVYNPNITEKTPLLSSPPAHPPAPSM